MRLEIARIRARKDFNDQDSILTELYALVKELNQKLTHDALTFACDHLDLDHLLKFWHDRDALLGPKLQRRLLKVMKRKHRRDALSIILEELLGPGKSTKSRIQICHKWFDYAPKETMFNFIKNLSIQHKWLFMDGLRNESFAFFGDLIASDLYDDLYKDNTKLCVEQISKQWVEKISDPLWHKKWFENKYEYDGSYTRPPDFLLDDHFEWYVKTLPPPPDTTPEEHAKYYHYPTDVYLLQRKVFNPCRRFRSSTVNKCPLPTLYRRVERIIQLLDQDINFNFMNNHLVERRFQVRLALNPSLHERLWISFMNRVRRAIKAECGKTYFSEDAPYYRRKIAILKYFQKNEISGHLSECPQSIFKQVQQFYAEINNIKSSTIDLLQEYKNQQDMTWIKFIKTKSPLMNTSTTLKTDLDAITVMISQFLEIIKEPRKIYQEIPYIYLQGTLSSNLFNSYEELYNDIINNINLDDIYDLVSKKSSESEKVVKRIMQYACDPESYDESSVKDLERLTVCVDYARKFKNDHELKAALVLIGDGCRMGHDEAFMLTYTNWWGSYFKGKLGKPYPISQPTPEEAVKFVEGLFTRDLNEIQRKLDVVKELPFESADTWIIVQQILKWERLEGIPAPVAAAAAATTTAADPPPLLTSSTQQSQRPRPLNKLTNPEIIEYYIKKMNSLSKFFQNGSELVPTAMYTYLYVLLKFLVPSLMKVPVEKRLKESPKLESIVFHQTRNKNCQAYQQPLNMLYVLTRYWQNVTSSLKVVSTTEGGSPPTSGGGDTTTTSPMGTTSPYDQNGSLYTCSGRHWKNLTGQDASRDEPIREPWLSVSHSSFMKELLIPYGLICIKYPAFISKSGSFYSMNQSPPVNKLDQEVLSQVERLSRLLDASHDYQPMKLLHINDPTTLPTLSRLKHKNLHQRCRACAKVFLAKTQNYKDPQSLEVLIKANLSQPIYLEALNCEKPDSCELVSDLTAKSKLFAKIKNHHQIIKREREQVVVGVRRKEQGGGGRGDSRSPGSGGSGGGGGGSGGDPPCQDSQSQGGPLCYDGLTTILVEHASMREGNRMKFGLDRDGGLENFSDFELCLLLEILRLSQKVPEAVGEGIKLTAPIKNLGNFLELSQIQNLFKKMTTMTEFLPTVLAAQDDMKSTIEQLRAHFLKDVKNAPIGLRALKNIIGLAPKSEVEHVLQESNVTLVRAAKMKLECELVLRPNQLAELCLCEPTEENIARLKNLDNNIRTLLSGIYAADITDPEILECLKAINGVNFGKPMNGDFGDGCGLARLMKPVGYAWNMTPLARTARVRLARSLIKADTPKVIGAAFKALEVLQATKEDLVGTKDPDEAIIHSRKRPDETYLSKVRLYIGFQDPDVIKDYLNFMNEQNFSQNFIAGWFIGVADCLEDEKVKEELKKSLDLELSAAIVNFGSEWSKMSRRVHNLFPGMEVWKQILY